MGNIKVRIIKKDSIFSSEQIKFNKIGFRLKPVRLTMSWTMYPKLTRKDI